MDLACLTTVAFPHVPAAQDDEKSAVVSKKKKERKKEDPNYDDDGICKICLEAPIDTVILECGHQVAERDFCRSLVDL